MVSSVWKTRAPSTAFLEGERFEKLADGNCVLSFEYEGENDEIVRGRLLFDGVEAFRFTCLNACTAEMVNIAYDKLVDIGQSEWLTSVSEQLRNYNAALRSPNAQHSMEVQTHLDCYLIDVEKLRHFAVFFDGGPCYEFICQNFEFEEKRTVGRT
jgi:hypothetical protein